MGRSDVKKSSASGRLTYFMGFCLVVNYAIGTGAFALPFALSRAGWALSLLCLFVFTFVSSVCLAYVVESMARAGGLFATDEKGVKAAETETETETAGTRSLPFHIESDREDEESLLLSPVRTASGHYVPHIGHDKIDYIAMCRLFLWGEYGAVFVHFCIILYSLGVLWAYAAVFSSSVSSLVFQYAFNEECNIYLSHSSSCSIGYDISVLCFAVFVTYLSIQDIEEQATIQLLLTYYRFSALLVMLATCAFALMHTNTFDHDSNKPPLAYARLPAYRIEGFTLIFSVTAIALDLHWNMPDILAPLRRKEKALYMALAGLITSALFYASIMIMCALVFGRATLPLVTLNWSHFTGLLGGFGHSSVYHPIPYWATFVKLFIICFPIMNQISVYPLVVVTVGDNYIDLVPKSLLDTYSSALVKKCCRLAACLPPILLALFLGKLDVIFSFTGLFAFILVFVVPCLLQLRSTHMVRERYGPGSEQTSYSSIFSHSHVVYGMLLFGIVAFGISVINLLNEGM